MADMRALHCPVPNHSKNKEKYHMGRLDHLKIQCYTPSKAALNKLTQKFSLPHFSDALRFQDYTYQKLSKAG